MTRRYLIGLWIVVIALAGCASGSGSSETASSESYQSQLRGAVVNPPRQLIDFEMPSTQGEDFRLSDYSGKVILLYFGYRTCPDVCPTTFAELGLVYSELGEPEDLEVVFVSVDPERDTMDVLKLYTEAFNEKFIGLRDEGDTLQTVMSEFGVIATKEFVGDSPLSYLIDHTATVFLIGPDGRLQSQYLYGTDYRTILHDVEIVLDAT